MPEHELLFQVLGVLHLDELLDVAGRVADALVHVRVVAFLRVEQGWPLQDLHVLILGFDRRFGVQGECLARSGDFYLDGEERLVAVVFVHNRDPVVALQRVPLNLVRWWELDDHLLRGKIRTNLLRVQISGYSVLQFTFPNMISSFESSGFRASLSHTEIGRY